MLFLFVLRPVMFSSFRALRDGICLLTRSLAVILVLVSLSRRFRGRTVSRIRWASWCWTSRQRISQTLWDVGTTTHFVTLPFLSLVCTSLFLPSSCLTHAQCLICICARSASRSLQPMAVRASSTPTRTEQCSSGSSIEELHASRPPATCRSRDRCPTK